MLLLFGEVLEEPLHKEKNKLKVLLSFDIRLEINTEICFDPKNTVVKRL